MKLKFMLRGIHPGYTYNKRQTNPWIWTEEKRAKIFEELTWLTFQKRKITDDDAWPWKIYRLKKL